MSDVEDNKKLKSALDFNKSMADRFAITVTSVFGSITFLMLCIVFFIVWAIWNLHLVACLKAFNPFPFPMLDMLVSLFVIILSVSVLINQNRQGRVQKMQQQVEFKVNVQAESEITKILNMLHEIHQHLGLESKKDQELEEMKEKTNIKEIHQKLDDQ